MMNGWEASIATDENVFIVPIEIYGNSSNFGQASEFIVGLADSLEVNNGTVLLAKFSVYAVESGGVYLSAIEQPSIINSLWPVVSFGADRELLEIQELLAGSHLLFAGHPQVKRFGPVCQQKIFSFVYSLADLDLPKSAGLETIMRLRMGLPEAGIIAMVLSDGSAFRIAALAALFVVGGAMS